MAVGIIAEYNPFHNGHMYHLNKVKEMFKDEEIVLVMSGNFTERGEASILDKWKKKDIAIKAGIDLVIELPYCFAVDSADYFAYAAVSLLEKLKVEKFVFGSETNDIEVFEEIVDIELNNEMFDPLAKIYMKMGENYPTALSKALFDLTNKKVTLPNDLLGISYVKAVRKNNYKIKPLCIKRCNDYNSKELTGKLSSATSIREALKNNMEIKKYVPDFVIPYLEGLHFNDDYFKYLKYKIMLEEDLSIYHTVDEGIEKRIKDAIIDSKDYNELINKIKSKRYTYAKISRMLNHILCGYTKNIKKDCQKVEYIRVLGFNDKGRIYLNKVKKDVDIPIISNYSKNKSKMIELEFKATCAYSSVFNKDEQINFIKSEYRYHPLYKEEKNEKN